MQRIMEKTMETTRMDFIGYIMGLYWDNGKENGHDLIVCWGYIGMMEKKMETTVVYWGYIGL